MSLRRRWRHSQFLADQFWRRWRREYVPHLIERSKWRNIQRNICRGDLVLIVEGIYLDPEKIEYNSGLRSLAKLMLNSLWGTFINILLLLLLLILLVLVLYKKFL